MLQTVATGRVLLGDREKKDEYAQYNATHVPDIVHIGTSLWGTDWIGETKVVSPFGTTRRAGLGTAAHGGCCADAGHVFAFDNTKEKMHLQILGCKGRGRRQTNPHSTTTRAKAASTPR